MAYSVAYARRLVLAVAALGLLVGGRGAAQPGGGKAGAKEKPHALIADCMDCIEECKKHVGKKERHAHIDKTIKACKAAHEYMSKANHDFGGHRQASLKALTSLHTQLHQDHTKAGKHLAECHAHLGKAIKHHGK
jgi:hypothetical protein